MNRYFSLLIITAFMLLSDLAKTQDLNIFELDGNWKFRRAGTKEWYPAKVPGVVHLDLLRKSQVDTEVIFQLIDKYQTQGVNLPSAIMKTYQQLQGEANIAFLHDTERSLCLATNTGSLYFTHVPSMGIFIFASEKHFLKEIQKIEEGIVKIDGDYQKITDEGLAGCLSLQLRLLV